MKTTRPAADPVPLRDLAVTLEVTVDSLRQRIHRGTLKARKIGPVWVVDPAEAAAAGRAGRGRSVAR